VNERVQGRLSNDQTLLLAFLDGLYKVLDYIVRHRESFLPQELRQAAFDAWNEVSPDHLERLRDQLEAVEPDRLAGVGLTGAQLRFKLRLYSMARRELRAIIRRAAPTPVQQQNEDVERIRNERTAAAGQSDEGIGRGIWGRITHTYTRGLEKLRRSRSAKLIAQGLLKVLKYGNDILGSLKKELPGGEIVDEIKKGLERGIERLFKI
jgi:hypothetical protein